VVTVVVGRRIAAPRGRRAPPRPPGRPPLLSTASLGRGPPRRRGVQNLVADPNVAK
jgi:hypothetical protein